MKKKVKFCPRCGVALNIADAYCIKCGYNFRGRIRKKLNITQIFLAILILSAVWVAIRLILKRPIIPTEVMTFAKTIITSFTNKTG